MSGCPPRHWSSSVEPDRTSESTNMVAFLMGEDRRARLERCIPRGPDSNCLSRPEAHESREQGFCLQQGKRLRRFARNPEAVADWQARDACVVGECLPIPCFADDAHAELVEVHGPAD